MSRWTRFRAEVERSRRGAYETLIPEPFPPLQVFMGSGRPRRLFYFTKPDLCSHWMLHGQFPPNWVALSRRGVPAAQYLEEIRGYSRRLALPVRFVGDLDPLDLTIYLMMIRGSADLSLKGARPIKVEYHGVSDRWLALRRRGSSPIHGSLGMEPLERRHHDFVKEHLPDLEPLIGPACLALLDSGHKLELEGACDPSIAGKDFPSRLLRYLSS